MDNSGGHPPMIQMTNWNGHGEKTKEREEIKIEKDAHFYNGPSTNGH